MDRQLYALMLLLSADTLIYGSDQLKFRPKDVGHMVPCHENMDSTKFLNVSWVPRIITPEQDLKLVFTSNFPCDVFNIHLQLKVLLMDAPILLWEGSANCDDIKNMIQATFKCPFPKGGPYEYSAVISDTLSIRENTGNYTITVKYSLMDQRLRICQDGCLRALVYVYDPEESQK